MLTHTSFVEKAERFFEEKGKERQAFLCYFDFAEFKFINRYYGIEGGNALLLSVETYLKQLPEVAAYERIFSDQFVFLVPTAQQRSDEEIIARYGQFSEDFLSEKRAQYPACNLRTYCGISLVKNGDILEAVDNANMAWRKAKKSRVVSTVMYDDTMAQEFFERQQAIREVNMALQNGDFCFHLQPKTDLRTGEIIGAEALARRIDANGAVIFPDKFLPLMEENGSVVELDRLILQKVCAYLRKRLDAGQPVVPTSVNISRLHIQVLGAARQLHAIAQEYQIPPGLLDFELTETILLDQFIGAQTLCAQLHSWGYSVSIDDFGAGYAGVNVIQELRFDVMKLDRKFLAENEPLRTRNHAILPNIIQTLLKLKIVPLCEGVETEEQCRYLMNIGCQQAQGFYFSKPAPPDQFYETFERLNGRYSVPAFDDASYERFHRRQGMDIALENLYAAIVGNLHDGVYFVDTERQISLWNKAAEKITGYRADDMLGKNCENSGLCHIDGNGRQLCHGVCPLTATMTDGQYRHAQVYARHKEGYRIPLLVETFPVTSENKIIGGIEIFTRNSPKVYEDDLVEQLTGIAMRDPVTKLPNRRHLESFLDFKLDEYRRFGRLFAVLFADINEFSRFNNQYGHEVGDKVLLNIGTSLKQSIRKDDLVGRWGGDEFVGIYALSKQEDSEIVAQKFSQMVANTAVIQEGLSLQVSASVGITVVRPGDTAETIIARADQLMYNNKSAENGRRSANKEAYNL